MNYLFTSAAGFPLAAQVLFYGIIAIAALVFIAYALQLIWHRHGAPKTLRTTVKRQEIEIDRQQQEIAQLRQNLAQAGSRTEYPGHH